MASQSPSVQTTCGVVARYLLRDEEKRLSDVLKETRGWIARRDESAIWLMRYAGVRVGTLVQLTVGDAQDALRTKSLALRDEISKRHCGYSVQTTDNIELALNRLLKVRRQLGLSLDPEAPLIVARVRARGGDGMTTRAVQLRIRYWSDRAGIHRGITPHWFRHTLAMRALEKSQARNPLLVVSKLLGHRSLDSTAYYTQPNREEMQQTLEAAA